MAQGYSSFDDTGLPNLAKSDSCPPPSPLLHKTPLLCLCFTRFEGTENRLMLAPRKVCSDVVFRFGGKDFGFYFPAALHVIFCCQAWKRPWLQGLRSTSEKLELFLIVSAVLLIALCLQAVHRQGREGALFYGRFEARTRGNSEQGTLKWQQQHELRLANSSSSIIITVSDAVNFSTLPLRCHMRRHHDPKTDSFDWK